MKKNILFISILLFNVLSMQSQNVMISSLATPNEPSILIDPKHPNVLVAGANIASAYYSLDTGRTWTRKVMTSTYGVWGDPAIVVDTASNFYFFHLSNPPSGGSWIDRIVCQKTSDNGVTWNNGSFMGLNIGKEQDKEWCAIDRTNNNMYVTWTEFDNYGTSNVLDSSRILFSKSLDNGNTWSTPKKINKISGDCIDSDNTVEGAVPAVGPNGEIYVSWIGPNGLVFTKSTDQGNTWLANEIVVTTVPGGWDYTIPGLQRANGLPITMCDLSGGANHGAIYINWSDQRNGATDTDIWLVKSTDGGATWSAPKKVNTDNSNKHQFLTWGTIDQANGNLYFVFYDRRNYTDNNTDVYTATSLDGGNTFTDSKISATPFVPTTGTFFGDYTNITAYNGIVRPIWARLHSGAISVWTDISVNGGVFTNKEEIPYTGNDDISFTNYPNPTENFVYTSYKLRKSADVSLSLYDATGKKIKMITDSEKKEPGKYTESIDLNELEVSAGIYFFKLEVDGEVKIMKQIVN